MIRQLWIMIAALSLAGCASLDLQIFSPDPPSLIVVLVGGNSEWIHKGGIWKLYGGKGQSKEKMRIVQDLSQLKDVVPERVAAHYFSWTGDPEDHMSPLPGTWSWITGGSGHIRTQLPGLTDLKYQGIPIAIVGWSNGGATAYELACDLTVRHGVHVGLLVTLDPVAWTTKPCSDGTLPSVKPAEEWISVYTRSHALQRLGLGNIVAFFGNAWDDDATPTTPTDLILLDGVNHGDTEKMWEKMKADSQAIGRWAARDR